MSFKTALADIGKDLESTRNQIAELHEQEQALLAAPVTPKQAIAVLERWVDYNASKFDTENSILAPAYHGEMPVQSDFGMERRGGGDPTTAIFCYFLGDVIKQRLGDAITKRLGREGITDETRQKKLEEVRQKRHGLEIHEELIIRDAEAIGMKIDRRHDADPAIVLGDLTEEK
jgi:hypothetical protein